MALDPPQFFERPQPGWQLLGAGMYLDQENNLHLFPREFLAALGWPDTKENRDMIYEIAPKMIRESLGKNIPAFVTSRDGTVEEH